MAESSSISIPPAAEHPVTPVGGTKPRRRHRPREETRALLLDAATRVAVRRVAETADETHNALADVRIRDVLVEVNQGDASGGRPMTTGAFYQIWADQADFQRELLAYVMERIATPGSAEVEALAFEMVSDGAPADEILRRISDLDFRLSLETREMFLALGLGALAPAQLVKDAQEEANRRYVASLSDLLHNVLRYAGRRLREDRTMEDLIWATEALEVGYLLRSRTDPEVPERTDRRAWSARATAYVGIVHAFTEEIPDRVRR